MLTLNIVLLCVLVVGFALAGYQTYRNHQIREINNLVYEQLDILMNNVQDEVIRNKILLDKIQEIFDGSKNHTFMDLVGAQTQNGATPDLGAAPMLSSLITVLVSKTGTTRLSLTDFENVEEEYVSIYVDTQSEELILSLNHDLDSKIAMAMANFNSPDDSTFH
jgi:hypothetical protein